MNDFAALAQHVQNEVEDFEAPTSPGPRFGKNFKEEWYSEQRDVMRRALVEPYSADAVDECSTTRSVIVVAEDGCGNVVVFDPCEDGEFALALRTAPSLILAGPRGDVVGCFLAR
jgi:hypothetical protein